MARLPLEGLEKTFLETPGFIENSDALEKTDEAIGKCVGPYKLLQRIGEGGCGVVYMAEQEKPVRRKVALKIIKLGMDTKSVIARFEAERQALALMDHPNIARVLDAGATETGRPYFVMELVRGVKMTEYCDQNGLDTRQRLALLIQVCQAIQHAHQKGVIHRDIKPSNILVTIIDGLRRTLQEREPQRPSAMVTTMQGSALTQMARRRDAEPLKLISQLRGDLDWIVIKALEKDRKRRYETANGLAMDVQRYLDDEPVLARPPSQWYRLQKLVRRNKAAFILGATVAFVLVCWWELRPGF